MTTHDPFDEGDDLEARIGRIWCAVLGMSVGADDDFFDLGGTSVQATMIVNRLQEHVAGVLHAAVVFEAGTVRRLAEMCRAQQEAVEVEEALTDAAIERGFAHLAARNNNPSTGVDLGAGRNDRAIFVLAPPRSGSTLLRVMLGGHPALFSPPELYLLGFDTLAERRDRLVDRAAFLAEGLVRAVMATDGCDRAVAERVIDDLIAAGTTTHGAYRWLQDRIGDLTLVDKTPSYAQNPAALRRAEAEFDDAFFIHLVRHPMACVTSFAELRADRVTSATGDDALPRSGAARGELWWLAGHTHIGAMLADVPPERQHRLRFEDLVADPEGALRALCSKLGIGFDPAMLDPYADGGQRMTDGITPHSRMLGDPGFHRRATIDPSAADGWRDRQPEHALCARTEALATGLGYALDLPEREEWSF